MTLGFRCKKKKNNARITLSQLSEMVYGMVTEFETACSFTAKFIV